MTEMHNPFANLKTIEHAQLLLDVAFKKAMKIKPPKERVSKDNRYKIYEMNRVNTISNVLTKKLDVVVKTFPSINLLHPFYEELLDILVDVDELKIALSRIQGTVENINNVTYEIIQEIQETTGVQNYRSLRKMAFGRISSMINNLADSLKNLEHVRATLSRLPAYNPKLPSVVVCGVPNVGKSSFIRLATSGKPDVASYPFTTKSLIFGHRNLGYLKIQFVDTPGLLDRPLDERNEIELQAIAALKHLSDVMVILVDISSNASSSLEEQVNLINDIDMYYPASEIIIAITKSDLLNEIQIEQTAKVLAELDISNHPIQIIHTKNHKGIKQILGVLEILISTRIIKSDKFKSSFEMEIHPDFLDDEDEFGY